ncbi:MAG: deoxyribodipyrimidine photo-lyase [Chitinophagales bacterium]|nr:deoxyribodipyrimidine photo-lyase [Chitinophagales bacterium]
MNDTKIAICWFRRDLRLDDNAALYNALRSGFEVLPLFIFDTNILNELEDKRDRRVEFIQREVLHIQNELRAIGSDILIKHGNPVEVWKQILAEYNVSAVFVNHDYESYGQKRDTQIAGLLKEQGGEFRTFKDIVVFEKDEIVKDNGSPYTVFTPYCKRWKEKLTPFFYKEYPTTNYFSSFFKVRLSNVPSLQQIGFRQTEVQFPEKIVKDSLIREYNRNRNLPAVNGTSKLSVHLRFGTLSIRKLLAYALTRNDAFVNELIWRDFYHQILFHFPYVEKQAFKSDYNAIEWKNNETHFDLWCKGETGIPLVDAGMRELNATGYMHNRVRMVVASFLTKNLLIDWRWGEAYFAAKLLDFDLAANNGGWQWAAGCGTDAAPYFRIFNPLTQAVRFDPHNVYIREWVPEFDSASYPKPIIDLKKSREECLKVYQKALNRTP